MTNEEALAVLTASVKHLLRRLETLESFFALEIAKRRGEADAKEQHAGRALLSRKGAGPSP